MSTCWNEWVGRICLSPCYLCTPRFLRSGPSFRIQPVYNGLVWLRDTGLRTNQMPLHQSLQRGVCSWWWYHKRLQLKEGEMKKREKGVLFIINTCIHLSTVGSFYCRSRRPEKLTKGALFHQDNAPAHMQVCGLQWLLCALFLVDEWMNHPPYSPDLAPSIFCSPTWKSTCWQAVQWNLVIKRSDITKPSYITR